MSDEPTDMDIEKAPSAELLTQEVATEPAQDAVDPPVEADAADQADATATEETPVTTTQDAETPLAEAAPDEAEGTSTSEQKSSVAGAEDEDETPLEESEKDSAMQVDAATTQETQEETPKEDSPPEQETVEAQEKSYSTRGRAGDQAAADPLEKLARDALKDLAREKDTPATVGASFLSDALTEEERRTRTRYLPEVDGMYALRKNEIKGDMALARSILSSAGVTGTVATFKTNKTKRARDEDGMDSVDEEGASATDEDRMSDINLRIGTKTVEIGSSAMVIPSMAFVAPTATTTNGGGSSKRKASPKEIEAVTAFNPPRPPESIGAKKKHRMLRWERRPADIEVDLNNYRKTVHKTREELKNAEKEAERIEMVENHLRRHFFGHLKCLNDQWVQLNEELGLAHQECVNAADLPTSRTRSRGAGKGSFAMKDVLAVLRARGAEIDEKGLSLDAFPATEVETRSYGAGGVGALSFKNWDRSTTIAPGKVADAWVLPGDEVQTPYGKGTVVAVFGPSGLNVKETPHEDVVFKGSGVKPAVPSDTKESSDTPMPDADAVPSETKEAGAPPKADDATAGAKKQAKSKKKDEPESTAVSSKRMVAPRVAVRMPFGVGFYPADSVLSTENPARYSDARLAERWKAMAETAGKFGGILDIEAMAAMESAEPGEDPMDTSANMAVDETAGAAERPVVSVKGSTPRLVPFGSSLLPTASGRGALVPQVDAAELNAELNMVLTKGEGVLGVPTNQGVPQGVRELEVQRQDYLDLQARVLQLRNELYRQRRTRMLNERTAATTKERSARVEALVAEMRADLKSLKSRLDEEIRELGISENQAENLLTSFYQSLDSKHSGQASPPKRPRKQSRVDLEEDEEMEDEGVTTDVPSERGSIKA